MHNQYLRDYFDNSLTNQVNENELERIAGTHKLIPRNWQSIIDVGCGDGRVSNPLFRKGIDVQGVDWSEESLKHCEFPVINIDITNSDLADNSYDGALCCEVLEHMNPIQATKIVSAIKRITNDGFIVSVPARENLRTATVKCENCTKSYHLNGHLQSFSSFLDVDKMVGQPSIERILISRPKAFSLYTDSLRRNLGYYRYRDGALCPYCGNTLQPPLEPPIITKVLFRGTGNVVKFYRKFFPTPPVGWFVCRYSSR